MANAMAEMWQTHLGVTVNVKTMKPPDFGNTLRSNPPEMFWAGWVVDPGNDPNYMINIFRSDAEWNYGHFSSTEFDSLFDQAASSHDPAERQDLYIQAERVLCEEEAAVIPLYHTFFKAP